MAKSPFQRAVEDGLTQPEEPVGSSEGGKRKRKSRPTTARRNKDQKLREKYAKVREEAQLAGIIPTTPEGAVRDERAKSVDPLDGLPDYVKQALRESWATPASAKPAIIAALLRPFFNEVPVMTKDGDLVYVPASAKTLNELARTILAMDQNQFARENPEAAGKAKGPTINGVPTSGNIAVNISLESNKLAVKVMRAHFENVVAGGDSLIPGLVEYKPEGPPRFDGDTETGAVATEDEFNK